VKIPPASFKHPLWGKLRCSPRNWQMAARRGLAEITITGRLREPARGIGLRKAIVRVLRPEAPDGSRMNNSTGWEF